MIKYLLSDDNRIEAYPEGTVMSIGPHYRRTPIHAAAIKGSLKNLDLMLKDVRARYQTEKDDLPSDLQQKKKESIVASSIKNKVAAASMMDITDSAADPRPILVKRNIYPFLEGRMWDWHLGMGNKKDNNLFITKIV